MSKSVLRFFPNVFYGLAFSAAILISSTKAAELANSQRVRSSTDQVCSMPAPLDSGLQSINFVLYGLKAPNFDPSSFFKQIKSFYFDMGYRIEVPSEENGYPERCRVDMAHWIDLTPSSCEAGHFTKAVENYDGDEVTKVFNQECHADPDQFVEGVTRYLLGDGPHNLKADFMRDVFIYFDAQITTQISFPQPWLRFEIDPLKWDEFWRKAWEIMAADYKKVTGITRSFVDETVKNHYFKILTRPRGTIFEKFDPPAGGFRCVGDTFKDQNEYPNCSDFKQ